MLDKQDVKLGLKREKVEAVKMETQADMMQSMNQASHIALAKMTQEAKILMGHAGHGSIGKGMAWDVP
jgi:hypothetical protein